jgi:hypothetical protein
MTWLSTQEGHDFIRKIVQTENIRWDNIHTLTDDFDSYEDVITSWRLAALIQNNGKYGFMNKNSWFANTYTGIDTDAKIRIAPGGALYLVGEMAENWRQHVLPESGMKVYKIIPQ